MMEPISNFVNYQIADVIVKVFPPVLVIFGTGANAICMIIWGRRIKSSVMAIFLFTLSILDTVGLYSLPLWQSLKHWSHRHSLQPPGSCIFTTCIYYLCTTCTGWIVVFIGFHRACRLCFPEQAVVNKKRAIIMILVTTALSLALSSHRLWVSEEEQFDFEVVQTVCGSKTSTHHQMTLAMHKIKLHSYYFNWDIVGRLMTCFFPATLTLTCLIAVQQASKTYNLENEPNPDTLRRPLSKQKKESIRMFYVLGIVSLICVVPPTFFKMMITRLETSEHILAFTLLSLPLHLSFAFKLGIYWMICAAFKQDMSLLFRTGVLMKHIRKLGFLRRQQTSEMFTSLRFEPTPFGVGHVRIVDLCSESTESEMSLSPMSTQQEHDNFSFSIDANTASSDT